MDSENLNASQNEEYSEVDAFSQRLILEESQSFVEDSDISKEEIKDSQQNQEKPEVKNKETKSENEKQINSETSTKSETQDLVETTSENTDRSPVKSIEVAETAAKEPAANVTTIVLDKSNKRKGSESTESDDFVSPTKISKNESKDEESSKLDSVDRNSAMEISESNLQLQKNDSSIEENTSNDTKEIESTPSNKTEQKESGVEIIDSSFEIINISSNDSSKNLDVSKDHSSEKSPEIKEESNSRKNSSQKVDMSSSSLNSTEDISTVDITNEIVHTLSNGDVHDFHKSDEEKSKLYSTIKSESDNDKTFLAKKDTTNQNSHKDLDVQPIGPTIKKHVFYVEVTYTVNDNSKDNQVKEISQVICDDVTDLLQSSNKRYSDVSTGTLGDISKNESPTSSISGPGPFQLPNRFSTVSNTSRLSTFSRFSTSSTSSILSSASTFAAKMSTGHHEEHFLVPDVRPLRTKEKLSSEKKLTNEQIDTLRAKWTNFEQLFKILDAIDNSLHPGVQPDVTVESNDTLKYTPEKQKLENIEEMSASKSEKRSVRRKRIPKTTDENVQENSSTTSSIGTNNTTTPSTGRSRSARKTKRSASNTSEPQVETKLETETFIPEGTNISVGQLVFARWTDRKYYSGIIEEHVKDNKWLVKFDDGNKKALIEDYIIAGCHSNLKGHSVYALIKKTSEYDAGIVTKLWVENAQKFGYEVEVDSGGVVKVSADELFLTEDQARTIKEVNRITTPPGTPKLGTFSLDNIIEGKRATRSNKKYGNIFSPRPGVSGTRKMTPRKLDSEDEKSIDSRSECALEEIGGVEPELKITTPLKGGKGPGKIKGNIKGVKRLPRYKALDDKINNDLGPVPDNSNIFNGLSFLLVCVGAQTSINSDSETSEKAKMSTESGTDVETKEFSKIPFLEDHLKQQVIGGGGILYQHFEEVPSSDYDQCVLITNRPNRTAKYIQCVAAGITIVSHEWVICCCRENKRLHYQELPVGWSLESEKFIESYHRKSSKPFQNSLIYLAPNMDKQFLKFWERVCVLAGGQVVVMENEDVDFQNATCVIADNECSEAIVDRALNWSVPLLSTIWVVQSIIHGETRAFDAHPKYAYDSMEDD